jgi:pilus assembly protein CpaE
MKATKIMSQGEQTRKSPCNVLLLGIGPSAKRELSHLLARRLPIDGAQDLRADCSRQQIADALKDRSVRICLVGVSTASDPAIQKIPELLKLDPKLAILAVLQGGDPDLILRCLRLGATDFLISPFTADQVDTAVQKLGKTLPQSAAPGPAGKVYCVVPAKGACGSTTIACALLHQWKRFGSKRVLLADLDPLAGVISFLLKVKSQHSFLDVLLRASEIDADLWNAMVTGKDGIDILLAPETLADAEMELTDASPILDYARHNYDIVIADCGSPYGDWSLSQASLSDEILLVITNELASLQSAQRVLNYFDSNGIGRWKVKLVVNRFDPNVGLAEELIVNALQMEVFQVLPSDYPTIQRALLEGKPIPQSSRFGKAVATLAERLAGRAEPARKASSLAGLLSLFSRTSS